MEKNLACSHSKQRLITGLLKTNGILAFTVNQGFDARSQNKDFSIVMNQGQKHIFDSSYSNDFDARIKTNYFLSESSSQSEKFSIETLNYESMMIADFGFFVLSGFWCQDQNDFFERILSLSGKLSNKTRKEEIKAVVTEKYEFEYGDDQISTVFYGIFGLSGYICSEYYW